MTTLISRLHPDPNPNRRGRGTRTRHATAPACGHPAATPRHRCRLPVPEQRKTRQTAVQSCPGRRQLPEEAHAGGHPSDHLCRRGPVGDGCPKSRCPSGGFVPGCPVLFLVWCLLVSPTNLAQPCSRPGLLLPLHTVQRSCVCSAPHPHSKSNGPPPALTRGQ